MKINPKVAIAVLVILAAIFVTVNTIRARTFSGANLAFDVGTGVVTLTNSSDVTVPVQLLGTGSTTFVVTSTTETAAGSSIRQTQPTGQLFEFGLLPGDTSFTVAKGKNVKFSSSDGSSLKATVEPISSSEVQSTILLAVAVSLASLYYISNTSNHSYVRKLIGREIPVPVVPVVVAAAATSNVGRDGRAYSNYGTKD